eukprot:m.218386 g.218386  ORF g.218386 m.218386 type:complete len:88 (+) comp13815_c1_seq21:279-542(+)
MYLLQHKHQQSCVLFLTTRGCEHRRFVLFDCGNVNVYLQLLHLIFLIYFLSQQQSQEVGSEAWKGDIFEVISVAGTIRCSLHSYCIG